MTDTAGTLLTSVMALAAVLGLILVIGRALRFSAPAQTAKSGQFLIVKETITLDAKRRLHLIQFGDQEVVLLTGGPRDLILDCRGPP